MRLLFWYILTCSTLDGAKQVNAGITNFEKMGLNNAYDEVVRGLIKSWESPIGYLQGRGYLSGEYRDTSIIKPHLDAIMDRIEGIKRQKKMKRDSDILGSNAMGPLPGEIHAMNQLDIMLDKIKPKGTDRKQSDNKQSDMYPNVAQLMDIMQAGRKRDEEERQLWEMEQRLKPLPESLSKQDQTEAPASPSKQPDDIFNKMKASPQLQEPEQASASHNTEDGAQVTTVPKSSSTYREERIQNVAIDKLDTNLAPSSRASKDVEAPSYLNWDIEKQHFSQYSPVAKEAYVNKLVKMFVEREKLRENPRRLYTSPP
ncbi:uncharacterized protein [Drosophila pseudoobscura]|uniref:Uncharacterized protein n=1 Tax=Drosophila pseudoobscura pseudoobscura TaxID=46245 RepID=A0A6I8USN4_DROPS|nr:uncharacterized protein LOC4803427 [Drosophila pseudoobscura]